MKKFLITGISGFAGPNLAKLLLRKGHEVHGVIRCPNGRSADLLDIMTQDELSQIKFHTCDLKDYYGVRRLFDENLFSGVFHLAAQSHPPTSFSDPILTWNENVGASMNIITAIGETQGTDCKLMFCSTSEVYGDACKENGILRVSDPLTPSNPYGTSKAAIDLYMQERMNNGFINGFVTRAFSHTGPRRGFNFSISSDAYQIAQMVLGIKKDKTLKIGNLKTKRIVIDVRDCVNAYYKLMMSPESSDGVFNICGKDLHEMQYFTDLLIENSGLEDIEQVIHPPFYRPIDIQVQIGDTSELDKIIDWKKEYTIERTMADLLDYWIGKLS